VNQPLPLPLSVLLTDQSQRFQLDFAQRASAILIGMNEIRIEIGGTGLTLHARSEQELEDAWALIAARVPGAHRNEVKVTYIGAPNLMEPYVRIYAVSPEDFYGDVVGELARRRGAIEAMDDVLDGKSIVASGPLADMLGLGAALQEMTGGRGYMKSEFLEFRVIDQGQTPPRSPAVRA
jgi:translation elongation factor EF-G